MIYIKLNDKKYFHTINGLWTGKSEKRVSCAVLRNTNFRNDGKLSFDDVAQIDVDAPELSKKLLKRNDILLEKSGGGPNTPVGRVALFTGEDNKYSFSNFCSRIRVINDELLPEYAFYFLFGLHINGKTEKLQTNTTNIRNLIGRKYFALKIPLISVNEQLSLINHFQSALDRVQIMQAAAVKQVQSIQALPAAYFREVFNFASEEN